MIGSKSSLDEPFEHPQSSCWLLARYHMPRTIDDIVDKVVLIFSDPAFQRTKLILHSRLRTRLLPVYLFHIFVSLQLRHNRIDVT